jgi:flagellar motor component MotA
MSMKLIERLNVLIQAATLSQKSGSLTLDEAAKAKSAIDLLSAGTLNQNYASAINVLIELAIASQKKGAYSLKDAYMIYLAIEGIESEFQNEVNRITGNSIQEVEATTNNVEDYNSNNQSSENVIVVPPKKLKRKP